MSEPEGRPSAVVDVVAVHRHVAADLRERACDQAPELLGLCRGEVRQVLVHRTILCERLKSLIAAA